MARILKVERNPIVSADGTARLSLLHADSSRDGGGYVHRFELLVPSYVPGPLTADVLIGESTSFEADEYYSERIENYADLKFSERGQLLDQYKDEFGRKFLVKTLVNANFDVDAMADRQFEEFATALCRLYLSRYSPYALNKVGAAPDDPGFYADRILFSPYEAPVRYQKTYTAAELLGR